MRNLFIETSCNDELHDLPLTGRQQVETLTKFSDFSAPGACFAIIFQCLPDCFHQLVFSYRLREKMNGAGFQGMHRHGNVAMAGQENDRQRNTGVIHLALQLQSVHPGHVNVQDHAALGVHRLNGKKFQRRPERLHRQAHRFDQPGQPFPDRYVVVDQENRFARGSSVCRPAVTPSLCRRASTRLHTPEV
jgi:hypothetical protein